MQVFFLKKAQHGRPYIFRMLELIPYAAKSKEKRKLQP